MLMDLRGFWPVRRLGALRGGTGILRPLLAPSEGLGLSEHSLLAETVGAAPQGLSGLWSGALHYTYLGWSSLRERWEANGVDRTAAYSGALIVTETGDLATGIADPSSPQGVETLQHLFWYALTAQAKGCKIFVIYPPWAPNGADPAVDADSMSKVIYWAQWLRLRPEVTIPVIVMPTAILLRRIIAYYAPQVVYRDLIHLKQPGGGDGMPDQAGNGVAYGIYAILTGQPAPETAMTAEQIALNAIAWSTIRDYACTGLGGHTVIAPHAPAADPLPAPQALPA